MPMLTQDDLKAIGTIVGEQIELKVPPMIRAELRGEIDGLEGRMNVKFDAVHEQIEGVEKRLISVESTMVTKSYLDDKLAHYVRKPF